MKIPLNIVEMGLFRQNLGQLSPRPLHKSPAVSKPSVPPIPVEDFPLS